LIALINNISPFFSSFFFCPEDHVRCESGVEGYENEDCPCDDCKFKKSVIDGEENTE
jgi:hypothetical protein